MDLPGNNCPAQAAAPFHTSLIPEHCGLIFTLNGSWSADITVHDSQRGRVRMTPSSRRNTSNRHPSRSIKIPDYCLVCTDDCPLSHWSPCVCMSCPVAVRYVFSSAARNQIGKGSADFKSAAAAESTVALQGKIFLCSSIR